MLVLVEMKKTLFLFFILSFCFCQLGCAKEPMEFVNQPRVDPDTVLHSDSRYVAVFGDIQKYTKDSVNIQYYEGSLQWIVNHNDCIRFIMHTGDVTDNNYISQWESFHTITEPYTDDVPFYTCIGNHDYLCSASNPWNHRDSTHFSEYVGFPSTVSHIEAYYETGHYENVLVRESLFGDDTVYLLILELNPRYQVVSWADSLVKTIPNSNIILINHRYISANAKRYQNLLYIVDSMSATAQYVWENLVYPNDNIRCVLCGHVSSLSRVLYSENIVGRIVPQIEFNIQKLPHGGDGVIELWEFDRRGDCYVRVYNTHTEQFVNDTLTSFQFKFR